jgi:hypothetical protein
MQFYILRGRKLPVREIHKPSGKATDHKATDHKATGESGIAA